MAAVVSKASATTSFYTLSLRAALPIFRQTRLQQVEHALLNVDRVDLAGVADRLRQAARVVARPRPEVRHRLDRKSTRLNSSHLVSSYAVLRLQKNTSAARSALPHQAAD